MVERVLMNIEGLKISKPGVNVLLNTDPAGLAFNSANFGLGVLTTGTAIVTGFGTTINYPDPGYVPVVLLMSKEPFQGNAPFSGVPNQYWYCPYYCSYGGSGNIVLGGGFVYDVSRGALRISAVDQNILVRYYVFYHG
jgi:hypothetical protein